MTAGRHLHRDVRAERLADRRFLGVGNAGIAEAHGVIEQLRAASTRICMSANLNCRVCPGHLAGESLLQMLYALVKRALRKSHAKGRDRRTRHVQRLHGDLHSLAFLAKQVGGGDVNILEEQFDCVRAADSKLVIYRSDGEAGRPSQR